MLHYVEGCYVIVTSLYFCICYDILDYMDDIQISCNYCDTPAKIKRDKIYMNCHCDDERRIIDVREYLVEDKHHDYLYSMFNDNFVYNETSV